MAKVIITQDYLEDIADAIREKTGLSDTYKPSEMAPAIMTISGGGGIVPSGTASITSNGTYNVSTYAVADVDVDNSYVASDQGKVVSNGALVSQSAATYTQNNTYNTTLVNSVTVDVPSTGGTAAISVVDTPNSAGGTTRKITALDISDTTAVAEDVAQGKYFYTADGTKVEGTAIMGSAKLRRIRTIVVPETLPSGGVDSNGVNWVECSGGGFNFGFDTDENGDSFNLTKIAITYACYAADSVQRRGQVRVSNNANPATIGKLSSIDYDKSFNNVGAWFAEYLGKAWLAGGATNGLNSGVWDSEWYRNTNYQSFQAFSMMAVYPASVGFVSGSTFEIWGRD